MSEEFKCEYCGRLISEEVCPFCGAVNTFKSKGTSQDDSVSTETTVPSASSEPIKPTDKNAKKIKYAAIILTVAIAIVFIVNLLTPKDGDPSGSISANTYGVKNSDPFTGKADKNGYLLTENGSTRSSHVLDGFKDETITVTALGEENTFSVPCGYRALKEAFHIMPVTKFLDNERSYKTSAVEVTTVNPYEQMWIYDSYNVLEFCIYNGAHQPAPLENCFCDSVSTGDISKITSFLFHDIELITDPVGILDSFGEPSFQFLSENFYSITYQTTCGSLTISYLRDTDGNLGSKPFSLTIDNCREDRPF